MQLQELQEIFSEEEIQEMQQYQYDELGIDNAISRVKEINADIERLKDLFNKKVEQLKSELDYKIEKLEKKKQWDLWNLQNAVKNAPDKRETKTQWKKQFLSGDVIVRKAREKMIKPKVDEEIIKEKFDDYKKEKIELNWKELKADCIIQNGRVINIKTGEDLTEYIPIEIEPEQVIVK